MAGHGNERFDRRELLQLGGLGGLVLASSLAGFGAGPAQAQGSAQAQGGIANDFSFVQLTDSHWGYEGPNNPQAAATLPKAIAIVNRLPVTPDFIIFTGDLTHNTDDPYERRRRMRGFKQVVSKLKVKPVYMMPGEHDAGLDLGTVYKEEFGPTYYSFVHKGVHFIALDNVSDPRGLGAAQLGWLQNELRAIDRSAPIVVFSHRPLFDLFPDWEWSTRDGGAAIALLIPYHHVTAFYGHIHQENHHMTGHIAHHSAQSLAWPLPPPGSKPKPKPVPWDTAAPFKGLGLRDIITTRGASTVQIDEIPITKAHDAGTTGPNAKSDDGGTAE